MATTRIRPGMGLSCYCCRGRSTSNAHTNVAELMEKSLGVIDHSRTYSVFAD
jgi:hypothetical protein